jgi:protein-ribulosamine 3-kinase
VSAALPGALASSLEEALERTLGRPTRVIASRPLTGGCVNPSARITIERGDDFFVKWNERAPAGLFAAEADGLRALADARALRVPEVIGVGPGVDAPQWLLLEYVESGRPGPDYGARLGRGLAALHRVGAGGAWGWHRDNFIGPLPQSNAPAASWGELWRGARLEPQLDRARASGHFAGEEGALLERVVERTPELLADVDEPPSLLHGDLWGGNVFADAEGRPVLIDPAIYRGHREVDLAMSELFGGFPAEWPDAYDAVWAVDGGYARFRRALYQLYYLLVHVNLFGAGYRAGCLRAAKEALRG